MAWDNVGLEIGGGLVRLYKTGVLLGFKGCIGA